MLCMNRGHYFRRQPESPRRALFGMNTSITLGSLVPRDNDHAQVFKVEWPVRWGGCSLGLGAGRQ